MADKIQFVDTDPAAVQAALVAYYENLTSKKLQPAQVETLVFNSAAYRISLLLNQVNETANANLIAFATGVALEELAKLVGVTRLPASPAQSVVRFTLVGGHGDLLVEQGLRVQSLDGQATYTTIESKNALEADNYVDVKVECTKTGIIGNGRTPGQINILLDPRAYVASVANITTSNGGSDDETDGELRERAMLAPNAFSVAGPKDAYKFWAKTAHPTIVDVAVTIGHQTVDPFDIIPGQVDVFPLILDNAPLTTEISDAVMAILSDEKIRPLNDTVVVKQPVQIDYSIEVNLTIYTNAIQQDVIDRVTALLQSYVDVRKNKLGIDVVRNQIIGVCQADAGVYDTDLVSPGVELVADESSFTNCTGITVNVVDTHDE